MLLNWSYDLFRQHKVTEERMLDGADDHRQGAPEILSPESIMERDNSERNSESHAYLFATLLWIVERRKRGSALMFDGCQRTRCFVVCTSCDAIVEIR